MPVSFRHGRFAFCKPTFYPPDESGSDIQRKGAQLVAEMQRVGWDIPNINVDFRTYGSGTNLIRVVDRISGNTTKGPFQFSFGSKQKRIGPWNVCNRLDKSIVPPGIALKTWDDHSNTSVSQYTGNEWTLETVEAIRYAGKDKFLNKNEFRAPDRILLEKAERAVSAQLNAILGTLKRMPSAPGREDVEYDGDANMRRLAYVDRTPTPEGFPTLYVRIKQGEAYDTARYSRTDNVEMVERASGDFVLTGNGIGLVALGTDSGDDKFTERAYEGYDYATTDINDNRGHPIHHSYKAVIPVEVKLASLNNIFVVDTSLFEERRIALFEAMKPEGRDRMTDAELNSCTAAVARTMVPATHYSGGYKKPTYLIGRQLDRSEARVMHGNVRIVEDESIKVIATDARTGSEFTLYDWPHVAESPHAVVHARQDADREMKQASDLFEYLASADRILEHEVDTAPTP